MALTLTAFLTLIGGVSTLSIEWLATQGSSSSTGWGPSPPGMFVSDGAGGAFATGWYMNGDVQLGSSTHMYSPTPDDSGFYKTILARVSNEGNFVQSTSMGTMTTSTTPMALAADGSGGVWLVGSFYSGTLAIGSTCLAIGSAFGTCYSLSLIHISEPTRPY